MKKLVSIMLALAVASCLSLGCKKKEEPKPVEPPPVTAPDAPDAPDTPDVPDVPESPE